MRKNLIEQFDRIYPSHADKTALIAGDQCMCFSVLAARAIQLAELILQKADNAVNLPIAVLLPKSFHSVVADLAAGYSRNVYMNLDIKLPQSRLTGILQQTRPAVIITSTALLASVEQYDIPVLNMDTICWQEQPDSNLHSRLMKRLESAIDTDPYCIINTSGSTGTPKAVILNHRSFLDFYDWADDTFHFDGSEILGSLCPIVFDPHIYELCILMLKGAALVLTDASLAVFPVRLLQYIAEQKVNFLFWVPTIMVNIANKDLLSKVPLPDVKTVFFIGEVFPTKQFNYWRRLLPQAVFANLYGPIEATVACTYYILPKEIDDNSPVPIGYPCKNTDIMLLNEDNQLCKTGETGELCVRGSSLAMGYYNSPEKTASVFVQNPLNTAYPELIYRTGDLAYRAKNGLLMFKGRKDNMIKHLGYRIELGEIEHVAINVLKIVPNCCVVYNSEKKAITMIYESSVQCTELEIKKALMKHLPRYMIPTAYVQIDSMPRNTNGKIDRLKLKNMIDSLSE